MGFRGVCRSRHSVLEPLRITLTQLKETLLLPLAHRMNPAERRSQKHWQRDFGFTSGQYWGTTLGLLALVSVMGHLLTIHLRTSAPTQDHPLNCPPQASEPSYLKER